MTDPVNIGPPRDSMAAEDCEFALRLYLVNLPQWPRPPVNERGHVWLPTLKGYLWMKNFENHDERSQDELA